jgi:uncharacterized spore protein YtfJ
MMFLMLTCFGVSQNSKQSKSQASQPPTVAADLVDSMAQRLSRDLTVKTAVGDPIKVGSVILIPILMIDANFAGAATAVPSGASAAPPSPMPPANLFFVSGEARPLGFVAITKKGTRFISVSKPVAK